jgi:hypothetical protein
MSKEKILVILFFVIIGLIILANGISRLNGVQQ